MKGCSFVMCAMLLAAMGFAMPILAGDLNPPGAPAPTMKTLDQIPPTWDQVLPAAQRFKLVMGEAAVLDKETGLVWERSLDTGLQSWTTAPAYCFIKTVGGRRGWRLPTIAELASLVDPTMPPNAPMLPAGHPFLNVQSFDYCSATADTANPDFAWILYTPHGLPKGAPKLGQCNVWCVRGGRGVDGQ